MDYFAEITKRGYVRAEVNFSGGNDEGGPDSIWFILAEIDPVTNKQRRVPCTEDFWDTSDELVRWLGELPSSRYGSFAGEFDVYGVITVDPSNKEKPIAWSVEESTYEHHEY
jgi:hypothetical protein